MTAAHLFVRQMLWRPATARQTPEPVIALLGPRGAGKSHTLRAISRECGGTIVHALLDFASPRDIDPIAAVAYVAFEMMRTWTNLPKAPTFHRVGLSLLALNESLPENRNTAGPKMGQILAGYVQETREGRLATRLADTASASVTFAMALTGIGTTPQGQAAQAIYQRAKPAIAELLQGSARRLALRRSERWLSELLEDTTLVDSLIMLSRRRQNPLDHLMSALLADLADNATRRTIPVARCECLPRDKRDRPHKHAWVLLVDNAENDSGQQFLAALIRARQQRAVAPLGQGPVHDPLLVVTAVDRWTAGWGHWWQAPWQPEPDSPPKQRIPLLSTASFDQWAGHTRGVADAWYPVWLDPPDPGEIIASAQVTPGGWDKNTFDGFVRRLSGDLPAAMVEIRHHVMTHPSPDGIESGVRSLLSGEASALWQRSLPANLPADLLATPPLWKVVPDAVAVACRLIEPGGTDQFDPATFPGAARTLGLLRTNLWISTFAVRPSRLWPVANRDATHPAVLHPWLVNCLLAGLAAESAAAERRSGAWTWHSLFATLSGVDGVGPRLYYELAGDRFDDVVAALVDRFVLDDHRTWVRMLDYVTGAPCRWPALESTEESVGRLVPDEQAGRTPLQATVANLVALLWLCRDPLTMPKKRWDDRIRANFLRLAGNDSTRADVSALEEAAEQFRH
jgi:hypothetical protein